MPWTKPTSKAHIETSDQRSYRLRREGNWDLFKQDIAKSKAQGMSRKAAYDAACENFPLPDNQLPGTQQPADQEYVEGSGLFKVFGQANPTGDMEWIYQTLGVKKVEQAQAPCSGAYEARRLVVKNDAAKAAFLDVYWKQFAPNKAEVDRQQSWANDDRELIELHERYRAQVAE